MVAYGTILTWASGGFIGALLGTIAAVLISRLDRSRLQALLSEYGSTDAAVFDRQVHQEQPGLALQLDQASDPNPEPKTDPPGPETPLPETPTVCGFSWDGSSAVRNRTVPGTDEFSEEARRLIQAVEVTADTLRALTERRLPVRGQRIWTASRQELSEINGLLLGYRLTLAWHRFQGGGANEPLENVVRLKMIESLMDARNREYRSREAEMPLGDRSLLGLQKASYEAATQDLEFAERDIATCIGHLEAGMDRPFWAVYRKLAFRTADEQFDLRKDDPTILEKIFRPLDEKIDVEAAEERFEEPVLATPHS